MTFQHFKKIVYARLSDEQYKHLIQESKKQKQSTSQIIRWALDNRYKLES